MHELSLDKMLRPRIVYHIDRTVKTKNQRNWRGDILNKKPM